MKKKILALLCVLTCIFALTACGSVKEYTDLEYSKMSNCEAITDYTLQLVATLDAETASQITSSYNKEEVAALYEQTLYNAFSCGVEAELGAFDGLLTTYNQMLNDMGGLVSTGSMSTTINGDEIVVTVLVYGNECDGYINFTYSNDIFTRFREGDAVAKTTFLQKLHAAGENMGKAGLNTLLGMGTVFIMLILISFLISLFKYFQKPAKKNEVKQEVAPQVETVSEELSDDTELVAVIMAAISAYESANGGSADGFVVRSIKKANRRI